MISVGEIARRDPLMAYASTMASELLLMAVAQPATDRVAWLRGELNKTQAGVGSEMESKFAELKRRGRSADQALFDALRLAIANQIATAIARGKMRGGPSSSVAGLGSSESDISAVFCGVMGTATVGGSIYTSGTDNPAGSRAVGTAGAAAMTAAGCNSAALGEQARIAEANARAAEANARAGTVPPRDNTVVYVAVGAGVLVVGMLSFVMLRKKS